jgi:hypothetical protein
MESSPMPEPVSQTFFLELMSQLEDRIDAGHSRVRQTLNDLEREVRSLREQVIELVAERKFEKDAEKVKRDEQKGRVTFLAAGTSATVTLIIFIANKILSLMGL